MINSSMDIHIGKPTPKVLVIAAVALALVAIPVTVYQLQQQQTVRQEASEVSATWATTQSASSSCPTSGGSSGAEIAVTFTNTESDRTSKEMDVFVTDQQTGETVDLGNIKGGETKSGIINTGKQILNAGQVEFKLTWTDGHAGEDSRTATYKKVVNCNTPTPTLSPSPTLPDMTPTSSPSATPCPTLGPVKNIHIDCPNCL